MANWKNVDDGLVGTEKSNQPDVLKESQAFEGWPDYITRNAAQLMSTTPYALVRSAGGLGNAVEAALTELPIPEPIKGWLLENQRSQLPTIGQAKEHITQYAPQLKERPGDEWVQSLIPQAALAYGTGGLSSGPALMRTLGMLGGSELGGALGEKALSGLGMPRTGREAGSFIGGHYGEKGMQALISGRTKALRPQEEALAHEQYQQQKTAFEKGEAERVAKEQAEVSAIHEPVLENARSVEKKATEAIPQAEEAHAQDKKQRIEKARQDIVDYDKNIKTKQQEQNAAYTEAQELRNGDATASAEPIMDKASKANKIKGLDAADQTAVQKAMGQVDESIINGEMTLDQAIELQKYFNGQIYKPGASKNFKRAMAPIIGELNKFIEDVGGLEHHQAWSKAENLTKEISELNKNKAKHASQKTAEIRDINKEKMSPTQTQYLEQQAKEATQNRLRLEKEHKEALRVIGPKTWEELLKDKSKQQVLEEKFMTDIPKGGGETAWKYGFGGIGAILGYLGLGGVAGGSFGTLAGLAAKKAFNEIQYARKVFQKYPSMKTEYYKLIKDATKLTPARVAQRLINVGSKMEKLSKTLEEEPETNQFKNVAQGLI
jgi:hypothetical protein